MRRTLHRVYRAMVLFGLDPVRMVRTLAFLPAYMRDLREFRRQAKQVEAHFAWGRLYPCLTDRAGESGVGTGQYFWQDLLVAQKIFTDNPQRHIDVGSRIDGFVAHVASFRELEVLDVRPLTSRIKNVTFAQVDMMGELDRSMVECCDSLSCLHAIEHFGLGRYGEPVSYNGHLAALRNIQKMLRSGGRLYLSVPIGPQRVEFNAQRVFSVSYILGLLDEAYTLRSFSFVDEAGDLFEDVSMDGRTMNTVGGCHRGCGIFEMIKL